LAGSHQDVGMERGIERYRFGARHGDDDGSRHELIGDGTISRPPLAGLDWLGGDSFDGAGSRSPGAVISDGQLIDRRCSWTRSSSDVGQLFDHFVCDLLAIRPKRTSLVAPHMSAFGGKADMAFCGANVCF